MKKNNFFKLLFELEKKYSLDNVYIFSDRKMGFPVNEVQELSIEGQEKKEIKVNFSGLCGVSSVLPPSLNEMLLKNNQYADMLYDFLKIFENRLFQLKYQIWKAGYPPFFLNSPNHPFAKLLRIISGGKLSDKSVASSYSIAGLLSNKPFSVMALKKICKVFIGFDVVIEEHCNQWVSVNSTIYGNMLGENCLLGKRYLESRKLFLIKIQCITAKNMQALYSDIALLKALDEMIQSSLTPNMRYKLYLSATQDFIPIALGNKQVRLGMGVMLGIRLGNGQLSICFN